MSNLLGPVNLKQKTYNNKRIVGNLQKKYTQKTIKNFFPKRNVSSAHNSEEKAYFERVIDNHEHALEGFFIVSQNEKQLEIGMMNTIKLIFELPSKFTVKESTSVDKKGTLYSDILSDLDKMGINVKESQEILLLSKDDSNLFYNSILD